MLSKVGDGISEFECALEAIFECAHEAIFECALEAIYNWEWASCAASPERPEVKMHVKLRIGC